MQPKPRAIKELDVQVSDYDKERFYTVPLLIARACTLERLADLAMVGVVVVPSSFRCHSYGMGSFGKIQKML